MVQKILVAAIAFVGSFLVMWYGHFTSKLPAQGSYLGFSYNSNLVRAIVTQFEYLWILIIINVLFTLMFRLGFESFKNNFLALAVTWLAMGPIAALVFNSLVLKERITLVAVAGIFFIIIGSVLVNGHKEIVALFNK